MNHRNRFDELWEHNPTARLWMIASLIVTAIVIAAIFGSAFDQWVYHLVK